jgi:hypothetical protein
VRSVSAQVLPGYGVGVTGSVVGGGTLMVGSVGVGAAVVGIGAGAEVVGATVGLLVVGAGAGLLVVGARVGAADVVADVGAAAVALGLAAGAVACAGAPGVPGDPQVTAYAAGLDAATAGLVTTSTTFPDAGTHAGNVSGFAACVPGELKVSWTGVVFSPLDIDQ